MIGFPTFTQDFHCFEAASNLLPSLEKPMVSDLKGNGRRSRVDDFFCPVLYAASFGSHDKGWWEGKSGNENFHSFFFLLLDARTVF